MRVTSRIRILSAATVAVTLLTACIGGATSAPSESLPSTAGENLRPSVPSTLQTSNKLQLRGGLIYAEQSHPSGASPTIRTFQQAPGHKLVQKYTVFGTIAASEPLALDTKGNLYLTVQPSTAFVPVGVYVYKPGSNSPFEKLDTSSVSHYPNGVAVDLSGLVAVPYSIGNGSTVSGVAFFEPGATTPCNVVQGADFPHLTGPAAFDGSGNLFVVGGPSDSTAVGEVTGGCHAKFINDLGLKLPGFTYILAVRVDASGNLVVLPQFQTKRALYIYPPGATSPSGTVPTPDIQGAGHFSFNKSGTSLWLQSTYARGRRNVLEYPYPKGGSHISSLPTTEPQGEVGVFPPLAAGTW